MFTPNRTMRRPALSRKLATPALSLGLLCALAPATAAHADGNTISAPAVADTYLSTRESGQPHGSRKYVYATTDETFAFLKFDTKGISSSSDVTSVKLRLFVVENDRPSGTPVVSPQSTDWSEETLTDRAAPGRPFKDVSADVRAIPGQWVDIPLDASVINRGGITGLEVKYSQWYSNFRFASRESDNAPQLLVTSTGGTYNSVAPAPAPAPAPQTPTGAAPAAAASVGFNTAVFSEEFTDASGIDLSGQGVGGKNFYLDRPFASPLNPSDVNVSNGELRLNQTTETSNVGLSSVSSKTGRGFATQYGYYEARMKFDEQDSYRSVGYPSFWMVSRENVDGSGPLNEYPELDVFEAYHENYSKPYHWFVGSVHEWRRSPAQHIMNTGNNIYKLDPAINLNEYHTYGLLWTQGSLVWYFDGKEVLRQAYGTSTAPNPNHINLPAGTFGMLDRQTKGMALILGTGVNYPMQVDWVRVWH